MNYVFINSNGISCSTYKQRLSKNACHSVSRYLGTCLVLRCQSGPGCRGGGDQGRPGQNILHASRFRDRVKWSHIHLSHQNTPSHHCQLRGIPSSFQYSLRALTKSTLAIHTFTTMDGKRKASSSRRSGAADNRPAKRRKLPAVSSAPHFISCLLHCGHNCLVMMHARSRI